ncbi:MAG: PilZ domain-containing protein [Planctomycetota bacterium]
MGAEKRRFRRLDTDLEARVKSLAEPGSEPMDVRIVNLGPEGAFLKAEDLLPTQTQIALDFRIDSYPKEINVIAKILWVKKSDNQRGMGCQFVHIPLFEKNIIIDYILRRYAEHQARMGS